MGFSRESICLARAEEAAKRAQGSGKLAAVALRANAASGERRRRLGGQGQDLTASGGHKRKFLEAVSVSSVVRTNKTGTQNSMSAQHQQIYQQRKVSRTQSQEESREEQREREQVRKSLAAARERERESGSISIGLGSDMDLQPHVILGREGRMMMGMAPSCAHEIRHRHQQQNARASDGAVEQDKEQHQHKSRCGAGRCQDEEHGVETESKEFDKDLHMQLAMLHHAMTCNETSEACPEWTNCAWVKKLFNHMLQCKLRQDHHQCRNPNCVSMRRALHHYYTCRSSGCKTCALVITAMNPNKT